MNKFLHIGFNWGGLPQEKQMEPLIQNPTLVHDWMHYGGTCWIINTSYDQKYWADYLGKYLSANNSVIICEIQNIADSNGWLPKGKWEWFQKYRNTI